MPGSRMLQSLTCTRMHRKTGMIAEISSHSRDQT
jgi:hypothetical protein